MNGRQRQLCHKLCRAVFSQTSLCGIGTHLGAVIASSLPLQPDFSVIIRWGTPDIVLHGTDEVFLFSLSDPGESS